MNFRIAAITIAFALPGLANADTVNLTGWTANDGPGYGASNWTVQGANSDSVFQSQNSRPSAFFNPGSSAQGKALAGEITVEERYGDDDFIGFVLGFESGEFGSASADFWLIDWKQGDQGSAVDGLALSHVSGNASASSESNYWQHNGIVNEVQRAASLGSTGWSDNTTYKFELIFTADLIQVSVDGNVELSFSSADNGGAQFNDGSFGFYNYSQSRVRYAGITEAPASTVPLPASLPLILAGFGALGLVRRRKG